MKKSRQFRPFLSEKLEDRTVPSALLGKLVPLQSLPGGSGSGTGGAGSGGSQGMGGCEGSGGAGAGASSELNQDARSVQQAFQTFDSSYLAAVAALRQTATSTAGPTQAGLTAFDSAIATATTTLDASISTDLSNLTNTGTALNATIDGFTSTLESEIESAATGLASSSNTAVNALNKEVNTYFNSALKQSTTAIQGDTASGTLTSSQIQTYNTAVNTAFQTFSTAISNAEQTSITGGTALSSSAVSTAVSALQTAVNAALSALPSGFTSSTFNPAATIEADLTTLISTLTSIASPTTGSSSSANLFTRTVARAIASAESQINQAVATAIQNYDNGLLYNTQSFKNRGPRPRAGSGERPGPFKTRERSKPLGPVVSPGTIGGRRRPFPARRTIAAGGALLNLTELRFLFVAEDRGNPRIDLALKIVEPGFLLWTQIQALLEHRRENLARPSHETPRRTAPRRRGTATGTSAAGRATLEPAAIVGLIASLEGRELGFRHDAILVGVRTIEEPEEAWVGDLVPGEFSVVVLVEREHPRRKVVATGTTRRWLRNGDGSQR